VAWSRYLARRHCGGGGLQTVTFMLTDILDWLGSWTSLPYQARFCRKQFAPMFGLSAKTLPGPRRIHENTARLITNGERKEIAADEQCMRGEWHTLWNYCTMLDWMFCRRSRVIGQRGGVMFALAPRYGYASDTNVKISATWKQKLSGPRSTKSTRRSMQAQTQCSPSTAKS